MSLLGYSRQMPAVRPIRSCRLCPPKATLFHRGSETTRRAKRGSRASHPTTWTARASTVAGTVIPSALAVLRLMTISYFVGACTGSSEVSRP